MGDADRAGREALVKATKSSWASELASMDHENDDPGTTWNERARKAHAERMAPRQVWKAVQKVMPTDAIMSTDIGNAYPSFEEGRKYLSPACTDLAAMASLQLLVPKSETQRCLWLGLQVMEP